MQDKDKFTHKEIGYQQRLFHIEDDSLGVFWHPKGNLLFQIIEEYIRKICQENHYSEVRTPLIASKRIWQESGHIEKFQDHMFEIGDDFILRPMNCPFHVMMFNRYVRTYKDLPLKLMEFGCCHRDEPSGSIMGLMRGKSFTQDDGHIFCTEHDIIQQTQEFCATMQKVYDRFDLKIEKINLATRPEKYIGSPEIWNKAQDALSEGLKLAKMEYCINEGEGAFYGPKIEIVLKDRMNREWQCGTMQVDFFMPQRLNATYTTQDNKIAHPIMIHRAILGSFERFIGILLEHYNGNLPLWLNPEQIGIISICGDQTYINSLIHELQARKMRIQYDQNTDEHLSKRINRMSDSSYIIIIGERELKNNRLSVRMKGKVQEFSYDEFLHRIDNEIL